MLQIAIETSIQFVGAKRPKRLPVGLTKFEVQQISFACQTASIYRNGLRVTEALRLRVRDVNFEQRQIVIREGTGARDRVYMLPESILDDLKSRLVNVEDIY